MRLIPLLTALSLSAFSVLSAKQVDNPDGNTLWMEDGHGIESSKVPDYHRWFLHGAKSVMETAAKTNGIGFAFRAPDGESKAVTRVNVSPDYPFLTFRITGYEYLEGYRNWTVASELGNFCISQVSAPENGIFVFDLYQNLSGQERAGKSAYLSIYLYNLQVDFEYIKLVKKPDYVVRAECSEPVIRPGSRVKFTAELPDEAEDVSLVLVSSGEPKNIRINDSFRIQLAPVDQEGKIWSAEVEIKSIGIGKKRKRHSVFMKMDVLGGELDEPVWTGLPYALEP